MINLFDFKRMSLREKKIVAVTGCVVALTLLDRVFLGPVLGRMKYLDEQILEQREAMKKNARVIAQKNRVESLAREMSVYIREPKTQEEEVATLLAGVDQLAKKTELYIVDLKPLPSVQEDNITRYLVDLNCEGRMDQLTAFMQEVVQLQDRLLLIDSFNISPKSKDSSVAKCNMKISSVIFKG